MTECQHDLPTHQDWCDAFEAFIAEGFTIESFDRHMAPLKAKKQPVRLIDLPVGSKFSSPAYHDHEFLKVSNTPFAKNALRYYKRRKLSPTPVSFPSDAIVKDLGILDVVHRPESDTTAKIADLAIGEAFELPGAKNRVVHIKATTEISGDHPCLVICYARETVTTAHFKGDTDVILLPPLDPKYFPYND